LPIALYDSFRYSRGLEVVIASDATTIFEPLSETPVAVRQQAALDYLAGFYEAKIVTTDELLSELNQKAAWEFFVPGD